MPSWSATREAQLPRPRAAVRQARCPRRPRRSRRSTPTTPPRRPGASGGSGSTSTASSTSWAPDDVSLVMEPLDGYQVEAEAGRAVALALELDDELRREGLAREVVHAIQGARKDAGLEVTDRIALRLGGDARAARGRPARTRSYVAGETLATSVAYDGADGAAGDDRGHASCGSRSSAPEPTGLLSLPGPPRACPCRGRRSACPCPGRP